MDVLPFNFATLRLCGIWHEENEELSLARKCYGFTVIFVIFYFTFSLTAGLALKEFNVRDFTESTFLASTYLTLCLKIANFVLRRDELLDIVNDLCVHHCKARDAEESRILASYAITSKTLSTLMMALTYFCFSSYNYGFVFKAIGGVHQDELPFLTHQFYNVSSPRVFYATATLQFVSAIYGIAINIAFDTMCVGLLITLAGQLDLNAHRLAKLQHGSIARIRDCVAHNVLIHEVIEKVESFVIGVTVPFFLFCVISIVASTFQMHKVSGIADAVYSSDWLAMNGEERKMLHMLMLNNQEGRTISYRGQFALNLDTFVWMIKTSYATLNLLHNVNI
ncbi:uncharacterized protein LOC106645959 [Copidosoma floridanum]|uniref:uncharacterized protein LOC106645959 n=1 Tax=Copidosoma floridanum TaxID=29053 RepID=UPI0006C966E3|nr:uncharacterized protein LOC106645959 [Copidosoma floridanum]